MIAEQSAPPPQEADFRVNVTSRGVLCEHPNGAFERLLWQALQSVVVQTIDRGPGLQNQSLRLWLLYVGPIGSSGYVTIPWGSTGEEKLLEHLQVLPGFSREQFLEAKFCTEGQSFLCWQRPKLDPQP